MKLTKSQLSLLVKQLIREADEDDDLLTPDDEKRLAARSTDDQADRDELAAIFRERATEGKEISIIDIRKEYRNKKPFMSSIVRGNKVYTDVMRGKQNLNFWSESGPAGSTLVNSVIFGLGGPKVIGSIFTADSAALTSANNGVKLNSSGDYLDLKNVFRNVIDNAVEAELIQSEDESISKKAIEINGFIDSSGKILNILIFLGPNALESAAYSPASGSIMMIKITKGASFRDRSDLLEILKGAGIYEGQPASEEPEPTAPVPKNPAVDKKKKGAKKRPRKLEEEDFFDYSAEEERETKELSLTDPDNLSPKDSALIKLKSRGDDLGRDLDLSVQMIEDLDEVINHLVDLIMSKHYAVKIGEKIRRPT